ncbi:MAG: mannonate dehydratase [Caldilineaceae bacterium]|nr:mannonate dehydratase [Caldilineaceae bacterium]MCB9156173.1 mannonate dehydratase [Caldilineaceae bacterium]
MTLPMRIGLGQFNELTDEKLAFIKQLGADDFLMNTPRLPGDKQWEYEDLLTLRQRADAAELRLMALENVPVSFYDKAMLGLPGRDEQIAHMQTTIRNMGKAGIPILGYHWMPNSVWRTQEPAVLRGGARGTRFNLAEHDPAQLTHGRIFGEDEMWANYEYYLERILPVAEEAGVKLALHPDDPPVESLGGVARLFRNFEGFKRAMDTFDSPNHGLDFCMGCWSEMAGMDYVINAVRHFGQRGKIIYVHFRDVQGTVPCFNECFINEGNVDPLIVMKTLKEVGFDGFMITDHVPAMVEDSPWGHRGRAYAIGYMAAMLEVVNRMDVHGAVKLAA